MLYKLEMSREKVEGYVDHINKWPAADMVEITAEQYFDELDRYSWDYVDYKQPLDPVGGERFRSAEVHIIEYKGESFGVVVAKSRDSSKRKFFKFGSTQQYMRQQKTMFGSDG